MRRGEEMLVTVIQPEQPGIVRCIVYMNMVGAGVVRHPSHWGWWGYGEIQNEPRRYRLIDRKALMGLLGIGDDDYPTVAHGNWTEKAITNEVREGRRSDKHRRGQRAADARCR